MDYNFKNKDVEIIKILESEASCSICDRMMFSVMFLRCQD
jgi:hypothetical protein